MFSNSINKVSKVLMQITIQIKLIQELKLLSRNQVQLIPQYKILQIKTKILESKVNKNDIKDRKQANISIRNK